MKLVHSLIIAIAIIVIDQTTKIWAFTTRPLEDVLWVPGLIELIRHQNKGIVANLPVPLWLIVGITLIVIIACSALLIRDSDKQARLALGILLGGAVGNLIDRLWLNFVRDWILLFGHSAINLADVAIALGLLWYSIWRWQSNTQHTSSSIVPPPGPS